MKVTQLLLQHLIYLALKYDKMVALILVTFSFYTLYSIVLWQQCLILDF